MVNPMPQNVRFAVPLSLVFLVGCPDANMDKAKDLASQGQHEVAGDLFFALAKRDPANLGAWDGAIEAFCRKEVRIGRCLDVLDYELEVLGNLERHKDALGEALEARALARLEQGLVDAALADLDRAERAAPGRVATLVVRAKCLVKKGDVKAATEALYRAKKIDPQDPTLAEAFEAIPKGEDSFGGAR